MAVKKCSITLDTPNVLRYVQNSNGVPIAKKINYRACEQTAF